MTLSRVTITIPPELLKAADRKASELARSRSWVLADALSRYLESGVEPVRRVSEGTAHYAPGLGASREAQLSADLQLTVEERVVIAEQTALISSLRGRRPRRDQVIAFDRYQDFLDWKGREALEP